MKTNFFLTVTLLFSLFINAQQDNCDNKVNEINKFILEKNYVEANNIWNEIKVDCEKNSEKFYLIGSQLLQYNIESNSIEKEKNSRELIKLYDRYDVNFPNNTNGNFEKRALVLLHNKINSEQEIYSYLDEAFLLQRKNFNNPEAINEYFKLYFKKYLAQKEKISFNQLLNKYNDVVTLVEQNKEVFLNNEASYNKVLKSLSYLIKDKITCENLTQYAQSNFEEKKATISWLNLVAKLQSSLCVSNKFFETTALELHKNPTATSANYLAEYNLNARNEQVAIEYYSQAITLSTNQLEKSKIGYKIASILAISNPSKAKEFIDLAIINDPSNGKNYLFLANLYITSGIDCATTTNEKLAIYKLASTTALKATAANSVLKDLAENRSKEYLKNVVLDKNLKNKTVKLDCWINETVQF